MTLVSEAMIFAAGAHDGMLRKGSHVPYILHPAEVAAIAATLTDDPAVLAAAVLHDVIEDCGVSAQTLAQRFGERVAELVLLETQQHSGDPRLTWEARKCGALEQIARGGRDVKIIALSDKLSNMRSIHRDYLREGKNTFTRFHQHDMQKHAWYYRSCAALLRDELGGTEAWRELCMRIDKVFGTEETNVRKAVCAG